MDDFQRKVDNAIAYVREGIQYFSRSADLSGAWMGDLPDAEIEARMEGHAMWDDPPAEWVDLGEEECRKLLLVWSRGYLHAEKVQGRFSFDAFCQIYFMLTGERYIKPDDPGAKP